MVELVTVPGLVLLEGVAAGVASGRDDREASMEEADAESHCEGCKEDEEG